MERKLIYCNPATDVHINCSCSQLHEVYIRVDGACSVLHVWDAVDLHRQLQQSYTYSSIGLATCQAVMQGQVLQGEGQNQFYCTGARRWVK